MVDKTEESGNTGTIFDKIAANEILTILEDLKRERNKEADIGKPQMS